MITQLMKVAPRPRSREQHEGLLRLAEKGGVLSPQSARGEYHANQDKTSELRNSLTGVSCLTAEAHPASDLDYRATAASPASSRDFYIVPAARAGKPSAVHPGWQDAGGWLSRAAHARHACCGARERDRTKERKLEQPSNAAVSVIYNVTGEHNVRNETC